MFLTGLVATVLGLLLNALEIDVILPEVIIGIGVSGIILSIAQNVLKSNLEELFTTFLIYVSLLTYVAGVTVLLWAVLFDQQLIILILAVMLVMLPVYEMYSSLRTLRSQSKELWKKVRIALGVVLFALLASIVFGILIFFDLSGGNDNIEITLAFIVLGFAVLFSFGVLSLALLLMSASRSKFLKR